MSKNINDLHSIKLNSIVYYYCPRRGMLFSDNAGFHPVSMAAFTINEYKEIREIIKPIENDYYQSRGY